MAEGGPHISAPVLVAQGICAAIVLFASSFLEDLRGVVIGVLLVCGTVYVGWLRRRQQSPVKALPADA